jgi:hypothetical protein
VLTCWLVGLLELKVGWDDEMESGLCSTDDIGEKKNRFVTRAPIRASPTTVIAEVIPIFSVGEMHLD